MHKIFLNRKELAESLGISQPAKSHVPFGWGGVCCGQLRPWNSGPTDSQRTGGGRHEQTKSRRDEGRRQTEGG